MTRIGAAVLSLALLGIVLETTCARQASPDDTDVEELLSIPQGVTRYKVVKVVDGDTIWLEDIGRVRLLGIDAPESVHTSRPIEPCGLAASHEVWKLIHGRRVGLQVPARGGRDLYGRLLAYVWYRGDLGKRLLLAGLARVERRWPFEKRDQYEAAEKMAKKLKRGVWSLEQCVPSLTPLGPAGPVPPSGPAPPSPSPHRGVRPPGAGGASSSSWLLPPSEPALIAHGPRGASCVSFRPGGPVQCGPPAKEAASDARSRSQGWEGLREAPEGS